MVREEIGHVSGKNNQTKTKKEKGAGLVCLICYVSQIALWPFLVLGDLYFSQGRFVYTRIY